MHPREARPPRPSGGRGVLNAFVVVLVFVVLGLVGFVMYERPDDSRRNFVPDAKVAVREGKEPPAETRSSERTAEPFEYDLSAVTILDCKKRRHKKHAVCKHKRLRDLHGQMLFFSVHVPPGEVDAVWVWRNECTDHSKLKRKEYVEMTECRRRALYELNLRDPYTVLTEDAPELERELIDKREAVIPAWRKQGVYRGWDFAGWSVFAYPRGAEAPEQHDTRRTAVDFKSTRL